ncbi:MFS transporter [Paractinoplanes lichenicola]|uniref:MFS transporter n=1 Tax=Paractinoplanes lichenicola TaxID=2802976 RepID=A0ABS1VFT2_9ACTN|nr:MFS transporter [Actinoplanes lichenicola]MBL7253556.1 MFS transporter [Actinoplanes lichenicola]
MPLTSTDPQLAGRRQWAALAVLTLTVVLLAVDGTVLALAVPSMTADLGPSATQLLWIVDVYSFALAGLLIVTGNLADRIGRKRLLLIGSFAFGAASALAAFAPSAELLIAARVLLGVAGATIMPSTLSIVRNTFRDPRQRTRAIAVWSAGATAGAALGPLVGGVLLEHFWWGSVFLINIPVMLIVLAGGFWLLDESRNPQAGPFDLLSAVLSIAAIVPIVYAVKEVFNAGLTGPVLLALALGAGSGVLFVRRQRRLTTPLIDISLFRLPAFSGAVAATTVAILAFSGLLFTFSQYLQLVRGFGPLRAGLAELPMTLASIAVVLIVGRLTTRLGTGRAIGAGLAVTAAGFALLSFAEGASGYLWLGVATAVAGLGVGIAMTLATDAVVSVAPRERAGAASAISETAYELGIALGIAILGSLHTALYRLHLDVTPGELGSAVNESLASASRALPAGGELLDQARHAFTWGMQATTLIGAVLLVVGAVIAWRVIPSTTARD